MTAQKPAGDGSAAGGPTLARIFSDRPLEGQELAFEFEGLARTLAELALNPDNHTPFTVVVQGGWGRGKTTLLKRALWMLEGPGERLGFAPPRRVRPVWFNAWKYPSEDTVLAGLLGALLDSLRQGDLPEQLRVRVDEHKEAVARWVLRRAAPGVFAEQGPGSRYATAEERRAFHDLFRTLFYQLAYVSFHPAAALRDTGHRAERDLWTLEEQRRNVVAVFLDDLDRCRPGRVAEVLEAINLFLDLPGVCFFLGLDWERLVACLPEAIRSQGGDFLEKIVQVRLDLPEVAAEDAVRYLEGLAAEASLQPLLAEISGAAGGEPGNEGSQTLRLAAQCLASRNPRHLKRVLNDVLLSLAVLRNTGRLGDGEGRLPAAAVFAWRLLHEVVGGQRSRDVRASVENLEGLLRLLRELPEPRRKDEEFDEDLQGVRRRGLAGLFAPLLGLSRPQLRVLIYLARAGEETPAAGAVGAPGGGAETGGHVWVEMGGGRFRMGDEAGDASEKPAFAVMLSRFRIARHPVTNAQYQRFVAAMKKPAPAHWEGGAVPEGRGQHPVVNVSWNDAQAYCTWLTRQLQEQGEHGEARLPTEAQWEYAARGPSGRTYPWGEEPPDPERANFGGAVGGTTPVDAYPKGATPEGVWDLAGNVWEWCADWHGSYPKEREEDPQGPDRPAENAWRVLRGGSFLVEPHTLRAAFRYGVHPEARLGFIGFRVVWAVPGGLG